MIKKETIKTFVVVLAGGLGSRFDTNLPKQFSLIDSIPVFIHTLKKFYDYKVILTIPEEYKTLTYEYLMRYNFKNVAFVSGGETRQKSVLNALTFIDRYYNCENVVITDACRPCIKKKTIEKGINYLNEYKGVVAVTKTVNTVSLSYKGEVLNHILNRTPMYDLLMPQFFRFNDIYELHKNTVQKNATDDAQLLLRHGGVVKLLKISLWEGLKLTNPEDKKIMEFLLKEEK